MTPERETDDPETVELEVGAVIEVEPVCATCARPLTGGPDEDPTGDAGMPICGECARERDLFVLDVEDGTLDGQIG